MKRRKFIQKTLMGTAGLFAMKHYPGYSALSENRNKKIKVGLIGAGWYGMVITEAALKTGDVEVVAVCDVDSEHLKNSADKFEELQGNRPKEFKYYQDLLDEKGLEAVFIGSVPHWHALHFVAACEKGLDIYCEKPLSYDVEEGKAMVTAAKKAGNIVQIGFQRRQSKAFAKAKELIQDGEIGKVYQVKAQIHYNPSPGDTTVQAPPPSLDWDEWCGPAPMLDYRPSIGHRAWRLEREYGNGHFVDWGIHHIDIIRKIMDLEMPASITADGGLNILKGKITTPDTLNVTMNFKEFPVIWQHRLWGPGDINPELNNGIFFYGEKGTLFAHNEKLILMSSDRKNETIELSNPKMQENHVTNFIESVKAKNKNMLSCPIEDAFQSTAIVQLAMASYYTDSKVIWDNNSQTIVGNPEAAKLLMRSYREGYKRPEV